MKKSNLQLKYLILLGISVVLLSACNRTKSLEVKQIRLYAFDISGLSTPKEGESLTKNIEALNGVTACTVNEKSRIMAVAFHSDEITVETIASKVTALANVTLRPHTFKESASGCPMHKITSWFSFWD